MSYHVQFLFNLQEKLSVTATVSARVPAHKRGVFFFSSTLTLREIGGTQRGDPAEDVNRPVR